MSKVRRVRLRPGKAEKIRQQRHPWLFSGAFAPDTIAESGDTVCVCDEHGQPLAYGHWDAESPIRCRVFSWGSAKLQPNETFWQSQLERALHLRRALPDLRLTNSYRLINSEGDALPGIVVDVYDKVAVVQLRTPGAERLRPTLLRFLTSHLSLKGIYLRRESSSASEWIWGERTPEVLLEEHGLFFKVSIETGQKTGFFLDQRHNRQLLRYYSQGRKVANFFAYTGGFTVYAAAGGATELLSVEIMPEPAHLLLENLRLNGFSHIPHTLWVEDAFDALQKVEKDYWDIIVLDPPAFTHHQDAVPQAIRGYKEINRRALRLLPKGGLLFTFSCSAHITPQLFRDILLSAAMDADRPVQILHFLHAPPDHPIDLFHPQGEYLKGFVLKVE
ncbi:MAG: class I SAM-dependent rRNA methyltransferase [Bacteroidia bacterium]|nr:class I SAM-dependent rRNA methyltransferase [Bacteroidia bacterium]MCX7764987.1 class I SAM-dependent rRNA methyltransferase [Bacteroidia bacterium]MDW8057143.1 class I SAM-dependent rRNA methyltransferase [Bacteroidia bacterium]